MIITNNESFVVDEHNRHIYIDEDEYENIYIISDIHGNYPIFKKVLEKISLKKEDLLIIAGDSCDRGYYTNQVYSSILSLTDRGYNIIHLIGNHEVLFMNYILHNRNKNFWFMNGGLNTLKSYNMNISKDHINYIKKMPLIIETQNYLVVHAGINPVKPLEEQAQRDLLWIRDAFINRNLPYIDKTVVFGHTITDTGRIKYYSNNTVGIDCGSLKRMGILELKSKVSVYVNL